MHINPKCLEQFQTLQTKYPQLCVLKIYQTFTIIIEIPYMVINHRQHTLWQPTYKKVITHSLQNVMFLTYG